MTALIDHGAATPSVARRKGRQITALLLVLAVALPFTWLGCIAWRSNHPRRNIAISVVAIAALCLYGGLPAPDALRSMLALLFAHGATGVMAGVIIANMIEQNSVTTKSALSLAAFITATAYTLALVCEMLETIATQIFPFDAF